MYHERIYNTINISRQTQYQFMRGEIIMKKNWGLFGEELVTAIIIGAVPILTKFVAGKYDIKK